MYLSWVFIKSGIIEENSGYYPVTQHLKCCLVNLLPQSRSGISLHPRIFIPRRLYNQTGIQRGEPTEGSPCQWPYRKAKGPPCFPVIKNGP
jgi:hypothetical protein